jgi:hypothetical protein
MTERRSQSLARPRKGRHPAQAGKGERKGNMIKRRGRGGLQMLPPELSVVATRRIGR